MKEFLVYTGLRILIFAGWLVVVIGIWSIFSDRLNLPVAVIIALLLSGVASYFLLNRPREALARRVDSGAKRASAKLEERRSREDAG